MSEIRVVFGCCRVKGVPVNGISKTSASAICAELFGVGGGEKRCKLDSSKQIYNVS